MALTAENVPLFGRRSATYTRAREQEPGGNEHDGEEHDGEQHDGEEHDGEHGGEHGGEQRGKEKTGKEQREKEEKENGREHQREEQQGEGRQGEGRQGEGRQGEGRQGEGRQGEGRQGEGRQGEGRQGEQQELQHAKERQATKVKIYKFEPDFAHESSDRQQAEPGDTRSSLHERAVATSGFGRLQWMLLCVLGLALAADGVELLVVAYVVPGARRQLCLDDGMQTWFGSIALAGMTVGSFFWGTVSDRLGRRRALHGALLVDVLFSVLACVASSYRSFLACRFFAGFGVGGLLPVALTYYSELCPRRARGQRLGVLLVFCALGGVYVSGLGWLLAPYAGTDESGDGGDVNSWRRFLAVCGVPAASATVLLVFMPESPRFLLQIGRDIQALNVHRKIFRWNHAEQGHQFPMPEIELASQNRALLDAPVSAVSKTPAKFAEKSVVLCCLSASVAFSYFGMTCWFSSLARRLDAELHPVARTLVPDRTLANATLSGRLRLTRYQNVTFRQVRFHNLRMRDVLFHSCLFLSVDFRNVSARRSSFVECRIDQSGFVNTNLYTSSFRATFFHNTSFSKMKPGCKQLDLQESDVTERVYLELFLAQLAALPGALVAALLFDRVGRLPVAISSMLLSGGCVLLVWIVHSELAVVSVNCLFNFSIVPAYNALNIISVELFPTNFRSGACGLQCGFARAAGLLGNVVLGSLASHEKFAPVLTTAALMAFGGTLSPRLTESKNNLM